MDSLYYLRCKFKVLEFKQFLLESLNPVIKVLQDIPKEGEFKGDWLDSEWKTKK